MQHPQPFRGVSRKNARGELYYIEAASFFRDVYPTSTRLQITHGASFLLIMQFVAATLVVGVVP